MGSSNREAFVKDNLDRFLHQYLPDVVMGDIDEIGLSYMVSILEELGSADSMEDIFEVEQFIEMMEAYLPGFGQIDSVTVSGWMFDLSDKLLNDEKREPTDIMQSVGSSNKTALFNSHTGVVTSGTSESFLRYRENKNNNPFRDIFTRASSSDIQLNSIISKNSAAAKNRTQSMSGDDVQGDEQVITSSLPASFQQQKHEKRWRTQSSSSTASSDVASNMSGDQWISDEETDELVQLLSEMFPNTCVMEINHCLSVADGNTEQAAQLILTRQECGQSLSHSRAKNAKKPGSKNSSCNFLDDHNVKKSIISKYSYVDVDLDKKEYKPALPKVQDKKLVRYLDSKIVSTRGERFTEIKKEDDEKMKKTFVNLKPAKQYRFH
ncbi:hypothetical protein LSH36_93g06011 [Paralvinella palmiformis]|uniref:CUE domain-containing protein n=1 Tax=Paralvinella palmiformis TaxID=53620 RepID=A0AAD9K0I5_9ANNE|nr:hypothetical protein LSH36_93g06011 [Paralvinella palmiformis]